MLPDLLAQLTAVGRLLDFVLVDGDHSFEGVQGDLRMVLGAPCAERTVILVHDTMNPEVRMGLDAGHFDIRPEVVYFELDFVCGYVYRRGAAQGSSWGGWD